MYPLISPLFQWNDILCQLINVILFSAIVLFSAPNFYSIVFYHCSLSLFSSLVLSLFSIIERRLSMILQAAVHPYVKRPFPSLITSRMNLRTMNERLRPSTVGLIPDLSTRLMMSPPLQFSSHCVNVFLDDLRCLPLQHFEVSRDAFSYSSRPVCSSCSPYVLAYPNLAVSIRTFNRPSSLNTSLFQSRIYTTVVIIRSASSSATQPPTMRPRYAPAGRCGRKSKRHSTVAPEVRSRPSSLPHSKTVGLETSSI